MPSGDRIRERGARPTQLGPQLAALLITARGDRPRRELADAAGVSTSVLADLEAGRANPTLAYLERVAGVYGVDLALVARQADGGQG